MIGRKFSYLVGGLMLAAIVSPAHASAIVRHPSPAPAIILGGVTVPAGADIVFVSGQLASQPPGETGGKDARWGDTRTQTVSALGKIKALLAAQGYSMADVVKLTVFVVGDPKLDGRMDFDGFNRGYKQFFGTAENPNLVSRSTVQVAGLVGPQFLIEIEAIAARTSERPRPRRIRQ